MAKLHVETPFNIELAFDTASIGKRAAASFIDLIIAALYVALLHLTILEQTQNFGKLLETSYLFLIILPLYFYHFFSELLFKGQSLGKKLVGIRVVNSSGYAASTTQYLLRWIISIPNMAFVFAAYYLFINPLAVLFVYGLSFIPDVIAVAISKYAKRLGDLAADTVVINTRYKMGLEETIFRSVSHDLGYEPKYPAVMRLTDKDINNLRNLIQQKRSKTIEEYSEKVAHRIEEVLTITNVSGDVYQFFEDLLTDYNFFTQKQ
jgi:uncharacterized RDD family membrane protein YckC